MHCRAFISYSQALRLRWICSEEQVFKNRARELKQHSLSPSYNDQHLTKQIQRALNTFREACLQWKQNQDKSARIPLVVTYHPILPLFHMTAKHHLPILYVSKWLRRAFWYPLLIAFHRPNTLNNFLVQATLTSTPSEPPGNYLCRASRCKNCPILKVTDEFSNHTTAQVYKVKFRASSKSSNIVYLITCSRCDLQYVGETGQPFHARVNGHRSDILQRRTDVSPVAEHYNSEAHSTLDMTVMGIELSTSRDSCLQKEKEGRWISTLETPFPSGNESPSWQPVISVQHIHMYLPYPFGSPSSCPSI